MNQKPATRDRLIGAIAERQHGVVTIAQLRASGVSDDAVKGRVRSGRLHRIHRGIYTLGHAYLAPEGVWMAAALASGGVLSHRSAAALWGLLPPRPGPIDVSVAGDAGRSHRKGIRVHRSRTLAADQTTRRKGIPVTTPARTIADLRSALTRRRGSVSAQELRRAVRQAGVLGLRIDTSGEADRTRSELEYLFLQLCRRSGFPEPEVNVRIDSFLVDFLWRDHQLIVETDGFRFHGSRSAFESDRDRDLKLRARGYEVIRLSYRQVEKEPEQVVNVLGPLLGGAQP